MATFYLLPPRPLVEDTLAQSAGTLLPGLAVGGAELAAALEAAVADRADVVLVFREELPDGAPAADALRDAFGAEPGDEVVEVRTGGVVRRWRM